MSSFPRGHLKNRGQYSLLVKVKCTTVILDTFYSKWNKMFVSWGSCFPQSIPKWEEQQSPRKNPWSKTVPVIHSNYITSKPSLLYSQAQIKRFIYNVTSYCYPCRKKWPHLGLPEGTRDNVDGPKNLLLLKCNVSQWIFLEASGRIQTNAIFILCNAK